MGEKSFGEVGAKLCTSKFLDLEWYTLEFYRKLLDCRPYEVKPRLQDHFKFHVNKRIGWLGSLMVTNSIDPFHARLGFTSSFKVVIHVRLHAYKFEYPNNCMQTYTKYPISVYRSSLNHL